MNHFIASRMLRPLSLSAVSHAVAGTQPGRVSVSNGKESPWTIPVPTDRRVRHPICFWGSLLLLLGASPKLLAAAPDVRFDTAEVVACRDVTTPEFQAVNPHERLVEARFRISAMIEDGQLPKGIQCEYQLINPTGRIQVVDYRPQTQQATPLAGNVSIEKKNESNKSLGLSISGSFQNIAHGTAGSDLGTKDTKQIRYELKPPMEAVVVAGTVQRGTGVFFRLRPSPEAGLEGGREFKVVMRVPDSWHGDIIYVRCEAQENRRGNFKSLGVTRFVVGLYTQGDDDARAAAENLVMAEATLRRTVARRQHDIQKRSVPTLVHKVGALLDIYDPRIPDSWLERLIYGPTSVDQYDFYGYLPRDVREVADRYRQAKRRMYQINGSAAGQGIG